MDRRKIERGRRRSDRNDRCPLTEYQAMEIIDRLDKMEPKIDLIYSKLANARSFLVGARTGAAMVLSVFATIIFLIYSFASGKISIGEMLKGIQAIL